MPLEVPTSSIIALLGDLVRIPSRGGIDAYDDVLEAIASWLASKRLPHEFVVDPGRGRLGLWGRIEGQASGPCYLLNATVDTAPFGDESAWLHPPLSAAQAEGWLYGRGSGDSKAGVAIFCHVLDALSNDAKRWRGSLAYVFDAAEHTGEFAGIRRFMEAHGRQMRIAGAMVGYPNNHRIATGGRGFTRATIRVHGEAAHTGSASRHGINAVLRAAKLIEALHEEPLPEPDKMGFPLPPKISVTAVAGGNGYSAVPDLCTVKVDVRTTPAFPDDAARALVTRVAGMVDDDAPNVPATEVQWIPGWPAYQLDRGLPIVKALQESARVVLGREVGAEVVGPSSVANYLYAQGVPATNGFGVTCENIHAPNERIALDSIDPVFEVYCHALGSLLVD